jgi:hypothetical protein
MLIAHGNCLAAEGLDSDQHKPERNPQSQDIPVVIHETKSESAATQLRAGEFLGFDGAARIHCKKCYMIYLATEEHNCGLESCEDCKKQITAWKHKFNGGTCNKCAIARTRSGVGLPDPDPIEIAALIRRIRASPALRDAIRTCLCEDSIRGQKN